MYDYKQVIVIRTDTGMHKGKMCGQVAHASISAAHETAKVVCKVSSENELEELFHKATDAGLVAVKIKDAGHTQLDPETFTCIGIGPDKSELIDAVTKNLKLL